MRTVSDGPARAVELDRLSGEWLGCQKCALARTRTQVVVGSGDPDSDLMFVGEAPGYHEDKQGTPFVGQAGKVLEGLLGIDRPLPAAGLHRQRAQVPAARQPRSPARRDRRLRGPPVRAGRADPAAGDLHARQLRDQAPVGPAARDHPRPRPRPAAPDRRRRPGALPDLPPGGGALHAGDDGHAARRLRASSPSCSRCEPVVAADRRGAARSRAAEPEPVAEPEPEYAQLGLF